MAASNAGNSYAEDLAILKANLAREAFWRDQRIRERAERESKATEQIANHVLQDEVQSQTKKKNDDRKAQLNKKKLDNLDSKLTMLLGRLDNQKRLIPTLDSQNDIIGQASAPNSSDESHPSDSKRAVSSISNRSGKLIPLSARAEREDAVCWVRREDGVGDHDCVEGGGLLVLVGGYTAVLTRCLILLLLLQRCCTFPAAE